MFVLHRILIFLFSALVSFVFVGGYILMRDKYWRRKWIEHGKPMVSESGSPDRYPSVKEFKYLIRNDKTEDNENGG